MRHKVRPEVEPELEGEAIFTYGLEESALAYSLRLESSIEMSEEEAILAILVWAKEELDKYK